MLIDRQGATVRVRTPAKVNLFLEVLRRRDDGYHDLATLMLKVGLFDSLDLAESHRDAVRLECDHPALSTGEDNLVVRAAALVRQRYGIRAGVDIRLHKRIPMQAGLAGGSSDAAATLAGLDRLWRLGLGDGVLARLGAELGSDVSFFFSSQPAAWCTGRGENVEPLPVGRPLDLVLACPAAGLSTASVFKTLTLTGQVVEGAPLREALAGGQVELLGRLLFNRLEEPAMRLCPAVGRLRQRLADLEPAGVLMSGSGSTVFAVARDAADVWRISRALDSQPEVGEQARIHVVQSCN